MSRQDVNVLLAKALDSPEFRSALLQVLQERATRPVRHCRCLVVEIPRTAKADDSAHITPGTVMAFVAREGEPLLHKLTETIKTNNIHEFNQATHQILEMEAEVSRKIASAGLHARLQPHAFPSFAELSYANKALVSHVYADELLRVHVHAFPYNGGYLDVNAFSMIEYYRAGSDTPLTCVLLVRQPKLSEIEREALRLVPRAASANNIAATIVEPITPALVAVLVAATPAAAQFVYNEFVNFITMLLHGGTTTLASIPDAVLQGEDFQRTLKSLPPEVTAAELLRLRTDILLQKPTR